MIEMGLYGLRSRKSSIWGQNAFVLVYQMFFLKLKVQLKTTPFWISEITYPKLHRFGLFKKKKYI